ncbi:hypothetical protein ES703_112156 [subsurface metagenome]
MRAGKIKVQAGTAHPSKEGYSHTILLRVFQILRIPAPHQPNVQVFPLSRRPRLSLGKLLLSALLA